MKKLFSLVADYLFVPRCEGCYRRKSHIGIGICEDCYNKYKDEREEFCDFCGMSAYVCRCIPKNLKDVGCNFYRKLTFYRKTEGSQAMRNMIYSVKRGHKKKMIEFFASELSKIDIGTVSSSTIVSFAPRTAKALQKYGYDQGALLAKSYAKCKEFKFKKLFRRVDNGINYEQKLLNFKQRAANIIGAFKLVKPKDVGGRDIILIDDVVTSGATLGECSRLLYEAGANNVICLSIAHTYQKNKSKND